MADYAENWDSYYQKTYKLLKSKSLWAVQPDLAVELDRLRFHTLFNPELPLIDLGCGTGEQTVYLKQFYNKVVGLDVAQQAIEIALEQHAATGVDFAAFDITDPDAARKIAVDYGSCNIYMRGVLHQTLPEHRTFVQESIKLLLGDEGAMYFIEVADNIREHLQQKTAAFSELPGSMQSALLSNLPPRGLSLERLQDWFPSSDFTILSSGEAGLATNLMLPDASQMEIPAVFAIVSNKKR